MRINLKNIFKRMIKRGNKVTIKDKTVVGNNLVFFDFGNNATKAMDSYNKIKFDSKCREVSKEEVNDETNAMCVDSKWYMMHESNATFNSKERKIDREEFIPILLYALERLNKQRRFDFKKGIATIDLFMLLPLTQIKDESEFRRKLAKKVFEVKLNDGEVHKYKINLIKCLKEGAMSRYALDCEGRKIIIDIGGGTIDSYVFDEYNNEIDKMSLPTGIRDLLGKYVANGIGRKHGVVADQFLKESYPFSKEQLKAKEKVEIEYIEKIMMDLYSTLITNYNEYNTTIVFIGGGAKALEKNLIKWFEKNSCYSRDKLIFLDDNNSVYANVLGMRNYVAKTLFKHYEYYKKINKKAKYENENNEVLSNKTIPCDKELSHEENKHNENIQDNMKILEKVNKNKKENMSDNLLKTKELLDKNYSGKEIQKMLGISQATFYRYKKSIV